MIEGFKKGNKCGKCCQTYENSFAYHIQQELKESLNNYDMFKTLETIED